MENIGKIGYDAYREHSGGVSLVSGEPLPFWDDQSPEIRAAWDAAALAVSDFVGGPSVFQRDELAEAEGESKLGGGGRLS
jgi:hypothetical protein